MCIADSRIDKQNTINDKIKVLDYDNDHRALVFDIDSKSIEAQIKLSPVVYAKNFEETKWSKFQDKLKKLPIAIPIEKNLSNTEIDEYPTTLEQNINDTVSKTVRDFKRSNSMSEYVNKKRTKWTNDKYKLISQLNKIKCTRNPNLASTQNEIETIKNNINALTHKIAKEFSMSCNRFWAKKAKLIDCRKLDAFFSEINRMFRPNNQAPITQISVNCDNRACINDLNIGTANTQLVNDKYNHRRTQNTRNPWLAL